jgi:hypothetical protein
LEATPRTTHMLAGTYAILFVTHQLTSALFHKYSAILMTAVSCHGIEPCAPQQEFFREDHLSKNNILSCPPQYLSTGSPFDSVLSTKAKKRCFVGISPFDFTVGSVTRLYLAAPTPSMFKRDSPLIPGQDKSYSTSLGRLPPSYQRSWYP